jgi:Copper transport outer membrane protein, MctB
VFDFRYHVASLAAVFFALVIGILVGVALASHGLGNTERKRLEDDLRRAQSQGDALQAQLSALEENGALDRAFVDKTYKLVLANRLKGKHIAVLFVGSIDQGQDLNRAIRAALIDADAGDPLRTRALTIPIDTVRMAKRLSNRGPFYAPYAGDDRLGVLGHALGQEFAAGTETPLWNAVNNLIVEQRDGPLKQPADGVVVVRTAATQTGATARFLKGLYSGIRDVGVPAVGVELTTGSGAATQAFKKAGLSTVDDLNTPAGELALILLLSDPSVTEHCRKPCNFGTKSPIADDGPLPEVVPAPPTTTGG